MQSNKSRAQTCISSLRFFVEVRSLENPVKVFEYLSAGKPVVAVSLPELQELKDLVLLYSTPDEFIANVDFALGTDTQALSEKRRAFARENTWEMRYQAFKRSVDLLYLH